MAKQADKVRIKFPEPFRDIFTPSRYKAFWGGRGSGKSTSVATALCIIGSMKPKRILCCREIQKSIADSVKKLLDDRIAALGLGGLYRSTQTSITTPAGTEFIFAGLRTNADSIKSMEGIDIAWVEEANTVSQRSMDLLIPTVRKPGSELFFTWNPRDAKDPVDVMFRGGEPPPNTVVRKVNFTDNPWFPDVLREDMEWDKRRDPDKYAHIWLGEYRRNASARVFKNWRIDALDVGEDWRPYFGADWGFGDPTVLVKSYLLDEKTLYIEDEAYKVNCEIDDIPALFAGDDTRDPPRWSNPKRHPGISGAAEWPITADSARPETISYMAKRGFNIHHSRKGAGSVEDGIEFLKSCDIIVHPKCKHTIDELTMYCYKTDPLTNEVLPVLADKNNHIVDALRYGLEGTRHAKRRIAFA